MIREKIDVHQIKDIKPKHETFLWHFLQKNQYENVHSIFSYFDKKFKNDVEVENPLQYILEAFPNLPYFESYVHENIDFLMDMGFSGKLLYNPVHGSFGPKHYRFYQPIVMGFHKGKMIANTTEFCYCAEGILDVIGKTNPSLLEGL
jgi:hypothetical protein